MNPATIFTEKYFHEEIVRFRQAMGDKTWWARPEAQRDAWISGLALVYLQIQNDDGNNPKQEQIDRWAVTLDSTLTEYERRKTMLALYPPK